MFGDDGSTSIITRGVLYSNERVSLAVTLNECVLSVR